MSKSQTQSNQQAQRRRTSLFQKYALIRLNDLLTRPYSKAFEELKGLKPLIVHTPSTIEIQEENFQVTVEMVRPKLKGELIIQKCADVSQLSTKRVRSLKEITSERNSQEKINMVDQNHKNMEQDVHIQNIKQLLMLQQVQKQKLVVPKAIITQRNNNLVTLHFLCLFIVLVLLYLDC